MSRVKDQLREQDLVGAFIDLFVTDELAIGIVGSWKTIVHVPGSDTSW